MISTNDRILTLNQLFVVLFVRHHSDDLWSRTINWFLGILNIAHHNVTKFLVLIFYTIWSDLLMACRICVYGHILLVDSLNSYNSSKVIDTHLNGIQHLPISHRNFAAKVSFALDRHHFEHDLLLED